MNQTPIKRMVRNDLEELTPLRRRTIRNVPDLNTSGVLPDHSDEQERSSRRSRLHMQRSIAQVPNMLVTPQKELTLQEAKKLFDTCVKMNMENKINAKNVWNLNIIDSTVKLLSSKEWNRNSLQVASTSLDVSSKVYGIRVDTIHAAGRKLASDMTRMGHEKNVENDDQGENVEGADENSPKRKKQKRVIGKHKNTISKDVKTLIGPIPKLESTFFQTSSSTESSTIDNLFSSKLPMSHCGSKLMIVNSTKYMNTQADVDITTKNEKRLPLPLDRGKLVWCSDLCADFCHFEVDVWDPENDEFTDNTMHTTSQHDDLVLDDLGIPVAELDGSTHDIFDVPDPIEEEEEEHILQDQVYSAPVLTEVRNVTNVLNIEDFTFLNDYLYETFASSKNVVSQIWAGPSHWKLKYIRPAKIRFSGNPSEQHDAQKGIKKKPKPPPQMLDFEQEFEIDYNKKCTVRKKGAYNPLEDYSCRFTLPESFLTNEKMFMKPALMARSTQEATVVEQKDKEVEVAPYNYDNLNDSQYCPQNADDDDDDAHNNYVGDNLIDLPSIVPKTTIGYSTHAKNMNMKKLKAAIWRILIKDTSNGEFHDELYERKIQDTTFSHVYKQLKTNLPQKMRLQLSCSLAYLALLHLANQCSLRFTNGDTLHDFTIVQD